MEKQIGGICQIFMLHLITIFDRTTMTLEPPAELGVNGGHYY